MDQPYHPYNGTPGFFNDWNYYPLANDLVDGYFVCDNPVEADYISPPRQRIPTPPPSEPTPEYLATSLSSQPPTLPPGQRKLLIFDLNGTLLLRSPRGYGVRKIYLRPYARCLVAYIAHPTVKSWLDCFVWSSAQAHNVREMVERVFGAGEGAGQGPILRAVWARDTLGLSREAFHQKTQTTKDLAKPWAFFSAPAPLPASSHSPRPYSPSVPWPPPSSGWPTSDSDSASQSADVPAEDPSEEPPLFPHSAETTLLVDDSPLKARLQPWNHLCVAEYDAVIRTRDLAAAGLLPDVDPSSERPSHGNGEVGEDASATIAVPLRKDRWRKRRKEEHIDKVQDGDAEGSLVRNGVAEVAASGTKSPSAEENQVEPQKDGVVVSEPAIDVPASFSGSDGAAAAADEPSVAAPANVSKRALRRARKRLRQEGKLAKTGKNGSPRLSAAREEPHAATDVHTTNDNPSAAATPPFPSSPPPAVEVFDNRPTLLNGEDARNEIHETFFPTPLSSLPAPDEESRKRKRSLEKDEADAKENDIPAVSTPAQLQDDEPYDPTLLAIVGVLAHVRSIGNVAAWIRSGGLTTIELETEDTPSSATVDPDASLPSNPAQWFTSRRLLKAWAARGRAALRELEIDPQPGIE